MKPRVWRKRNLQRRAIAAEEVEAARKAAEKYQAEWRAKDEAEAAHKAEVKTVVVWKAEEGAEAEKAA